MGDLKYTMTYNRKDWFIQEYQKYMKVGGIQKVYCGIEVITKIALVEKVMNLEK